MIFAARPAVAGIITTLFVLLVAGSPSEAREPFTLQLRWLPQAQFMGFYVAKAKGFYEAKV